MASKSLKSLTDLTPDPKNANKGTARGKDLVGKSLRELGAGRSILVDASGATIAGNKTLEQATALGLPVRVIETDGSELVVVQRTDLDLNEPMGKARKLAYADNRAGQLGLDWDAQQIAADVAAGLDLGALDFDADIIGVFDVDGIDAPALRDGDRAPFIQMTFTLHDEQAEEINAALSKARGEGGGQSAVNENSNGNALTFIATRFNRG
jgi:hypothetical protein